LAFSDPITFRMGECMPMLSTIHDSKTSAFSEIMQAVEFIFFLGLAVFVMMPLYLLTTLPPLVVVVASVLVSAGLVTWVEPRASRWLKDETEQDR
jgi:hypothetical protein